jgi:small-conductance mechanosensitive channel
MMKVIEKLMNTMEKLEEIHMKVVVTLLIILSILGLFLCIEVELGRIHTWGIVVFTTLVSFFFIYSIAFLIVADLVLSKKRAMTMKKWRPICGICGKVDSLWPYKAPPPPLPRSGNRRSQRYCWH